MITADNLSKRYKKKLAVDSLSFTVETGKVTGFLGPNGAGKSTIHMLLYVAIDLALSAVLFVRRDAN